MKKNEIKQLLNTQEFYEVMYAYRIANQNNQENVVNKFNDVKDWIAEQLADEVEPEEPIEEPEKEMDWFEREAKAQQYGNMNTFH